MTKQLNVDRSGTAFQCFTCDTTRLGETCYELGDHFFCEECVEYALALLWRFCLSVRRVQR